MQIAVPRMRAVGLGSTTERAKGSSGMHAREPVFPPEPASGVRLIAHGGFEILDARGTVVAWREDILDALPLQREMDAAEVVRRVSDGMIVATKFRVRGDHLYRVIWEMTHEPFWRSR